MSEMFDRLAKWTAAGGSRRDVLKYLGGFLAGGFLMGVTSKASADAPGGSGIAKACRDYCKSCEGLGGGAHGKCINACKNCKGNIKNLCGKCSKTNRVVTCCTGGAACCTPKGATPFCVNTSTSANNCGACGNVCGNNAAGVALGCCSGSCTDLTTAKNCGKCGNACTGTTPNCCPGGCTDLLTDAKNCGACGTVCLATQTCTAGKCV